jgi:uncharacterized OB-fold protein
VGKVGCFQNVYFELNDSHAGKPRQRTQQAQMIGKEQAEKSKGLFSAEDWACSKCGNVNWARRNTCNMCNAPKHVEMTPRTGAH